MTKKVHIRVHQTPFFLTTSFVELFFPSNILNDYIPSKDNALEEVVDVLTKTCSVAQEPAASTLCHRLITPTGPILLTIPRASE